MNLINSLKVALYYKQNFATIPNKVGIENGLSNYFLCSHERKFVWNDTSLKNVSNEKTRTMCKICSKLTQKYQNDATDVALIFWLLILNRFNEVYFSNFRYSCFFPENIQIHSVIWHSSFFFYGTQKIIPWYDKTLRMFSLLCWLYVLIMSRMRFRVNPHSIVAWMLRNSLLEAGAKSEV